MNNTGSSLNTAHYKQAPDRQDQMTKQEAFKKKEKGKLKTDQCENVQLPAEVNTHRPAFSKMLEEFESI